MYIYTRATCMYFRHIPNPKISERSIYRFFLDLNFTRWNFLFYVVDGCTPVFRGAKCNLPHQITLYFSTHLKIFRLSLWKNLLSSFLWGTQATSYLTRQTFWRETSVPLQADLFWFHEREETTSLGREIPSGVGVTNNLQSPPCISPSLSRTLAFDRDVS